MANDLVIYGHTYQNVAGFKATDSNNVEQRYYQPEGTKNITENGTVDVTAFASANVNIPMNYTFLHSEDIDVTTTSTSAITVKNISNSAFVRQDAMILVRVRDKAGKRNGYFYESDVIFLPVASRSSNNNAGRKLYRIDNSGNVIVYDITSAGITGVYGVCARKITALNPTDTIEIVARYNSSNTGTIDGTYTVEVYALSFPDNVSPFDA